MKAYTDKQWIGLARWLGFTITDDPYGVNAQQHWICVWINGLRYPLDRFKRWALSLEGRVAIEDKSIEADLDLSVYKTTHQCSGPKDGTVWFIVYRYEPCTYFGDGDTAAEAWVDAGMNLMEVPK